MSKLAAYDCFLKHSWEIRGLCLMKLSRKTVTNLPCFWSTITYKLVFVDFHSVIAIFL